MINNPPERKEVGVLAAIVTLIAAFAALKKQYLIAVIGLIFSIFLWGLFFTGSENYAVSVLGLSRLSKDVEIQKTYPVIEAESPDDLRSKMEAYGKIYLWLPCEPGGDFFQQKTFLITRWTLPKESIKCPSGRYMIKYGKDS